MLKTLTTILLSTLIISGCSGLPAQNLDLHPAFDVTEQLPANTRIQVKAIDTRDSALVGQRLDRLKNTAPLSLIDAEELLSHSVEHALEDMGISNFARGEFTLTLYLDELSYQAQAKAVLQEVTTSVRLRLKIEKAGEHYQGKYSTESSKGFASTPTPADNEEMFNQLVGLTLSRAFTDQKFLDFIRFK
ncbi:MAG: YajG family lipoprotein [Pontibacterium sp.]